MKSQEKIRQVRYNWSQQCEHRQVLWRWWGRGRGVEEPGVRKGKRFLLLASSTSCECSMETTRNSVKVNAGNKVMKIGRKSDRLGIHCSRSRVRMSFNIRETSNVFIPMEDQNLITSDGVLTTPIILSPSPCYSEWNASGTVCTKVKSGKYRGVFKVKRQEKIRQVRYNWSQQCEQRQVLWGWVRNQVSGRVSVR